MVLAHLPYANKNKYVGEFKNGVEDGYGTLYINQDGQYYGDKYVGEFSKGNFNGNGKYYFNNGQTYDGNFQNGVIQGEGTE